VIRFQIPKSRNQWILLLLGLATTVGTAIPLLQGAYSLGWPKLDGVITSSREKPGHRVIGVDIRYQYTAAGQTFTGDRYRFAFILVRDRMRSRDVHLILGRYPPGEPVKVAVNPADPSDSVLIPGPDLETLFPFVLGLFLIVLGLGQIDRTAPLRVPELQPAGPRYKLAIALAIIGGGLCLFGASHVYQGIASTAWPTVDGKIVYSHTRSVQHYETLLWYEYYVGNQRFLGNNYRTGGNVTLFRDVAEAAARRYPKGQTVKVYYNPMNPGEALLEPGTWWGNYVLPVLGLIVLAAAWLAKKYAEAMSLRRRPSV
jgi:hypothetical protein